MGLNFWFRHWFAVTILVLIPFSFLSFMVVTGCVEKPVTAHLNWISSSFFWFAWHGHCTVGKYNPSMCHSLCDPNCLNYWSIFCGLKARPCVSGFSRNADHSPLLHYWSFWLTFLNFICKQIFQGEARVWVAAIWSLWPDYYAGFWGAHKATSCVL